MDPDVVALIQRRLDVTERRLAEVAAMEGRTFDSSAEGRYRRGIDGLVTAVKLHVGFRGCFDDTAIVEKCLRHAKVLEAAADVLDERDERGKYQKRWIIEQRAELCLDKRFDGMPVADMFREIARAERSEVESALLTERDRDENCWQMVAAEWLLLRRACGKPEPKNSEKAVLDLVEIFRAAGVPLTQSGARSLLRRTVAAMRYA